MAEARRPRMKLVWFMLTAAPILATAVAALVAVLVGTQILRYGERTTAWFFRSVPYVLMGMHVILFLMLLALARADRITLRSLGWRLPGGSKSLWRESAVGLVSGLLLWLFSAFALIPVLELARATLGDLPMGTGPAFVEGLIASNRIPWLVVGCVSAGIVEESLYRGYAMLGLSSRIGNGWAVVVSSFLFGVLHFGDGLWPMFGTMVLGALLASLSRWRTNLIAPAIAHAIFNGASILSL